MWSLNPSVYLQHAWYGTKTVWGKIALILFYTFIWITILSSVWTLIDPSSQGSGCVLDTFDKETRSQMVSGMRMFALVLIGFLFYADKGGLHVGNVGIVSVVSVLVAYMSTTMEYSTEAAKCMTGMRMSMWIWAGWVVLALVFQILDDKFGDCGSAEETRPINV